MASTEQPMPAAAPTPSLPFPLQEGEAVIALKRRHWLFLWPKILGGILLAVLPVVLLTVLFDAVDILKGTFESIFWIAAALYIIYWIVRIALTWYHYQHDIWVVTNQRLIDSYRRHPFDLKISTADLVNVQDMTVQRAGVLSTMMDFGSVVCQTASSDQVFVISGVPDPRALQILVDRERDRERMRVRGL